MFPIPKTAGDTCHEPIAIIGIGCRFPGAISSTSQMWDLLKDGRSGHSTSIPKSRFNHEGFYHPNKDRPGSINATGGYFLEDDPRDFENGFFGINNLEATFMDPQQRKLLEVVYESFENAGYSLEKISGRNVGCYVANFTADFLQMQAKDPETYHRYSATGMGITIIGNRISHVFNLLGPSFTVDTACSSSLYGLHLACTALKTGECDSALVAGANLILTPEIHLGAVKAGILSDTSTCHSFDASADGYGRAEGVGSLYLKRLSDAIRDGDPIRSVIRGTAVNSNGKTNGITLPSADGQEAVIRKAYAQAGLTPDGTDYVETHTTGTPVGDPIEVEALARVFRHRSGQPTLIGTVKSNLGHCEAVSGICSIIKVTLALENCLIPATIGIDNLNPNLRLDERNVKVVTTPTKWPDSSPRRASINSFGYGGANAHAILEAAEFHVPQEYIARRPNQCPSLKFILPFSANTQPSLAGQVTDFGSSNLENVDIQNLVYTLGRRSNLSIRGFLLSQKRTLTQDLVMSNLRQLPGTVPGGPKLPYAFVFTGQGAQWPRMGHELLKRFPSYGKAIEDLDARLCILQGSSKWTIRDSILEPCETSMIHTSQISQTICTAIQLALVILLKEWNVTPSAVVGHSSGEIASAFAAGYLTADEAITIAYYRGMIVSKSPMKGAMAAIGLDRNSVSLEISNLNLQDRANVACVNSPASVTISGNESAIDELLVLFQKRGTFARKLKTDGRAYHSHHMTGLGQGYQDLIAQAEFPVKDYFVQSPIQMFSSVTGKPISCSTVNDPSYWRRNLESTVLFQDAIEALLENERCHLIEIGPHSALELPIKQISMEMQLDSGQIKYSTTLSRGKDSIDCMLSLAGTLYLHGNDIPFDKVNTFAHNNTNDASVDFGSRILTNLPIYRWNYGQRLWQEPRKSSEFRNRRFPRHDLLGSVVHGGPGEMHTWRNVLHEKNLSWLRDHQLNGEVVFPGAGYIAMAVEALHQVQPVDFANASFFEFRQVRFLNALILSQSLQVEVFTQFKRHQLSETTTSVTWWHFEITSYIGDISTVHANGQISLGKPGAIMTEVIDFADTSMKQQNSGPWYRQLLAEGFNFGPSFRSMSTICTPILKEKRQATSNIVLDQALENSRNEFESSYLVHPLIIDSLLQTMLISSAVGVLKDLHVKVPFSIGQMKIGNPSSHITKGVVKATSKVVGFGTINGEAELSDPDGRVIVQMSNVRAVANQGGLIQETKLPERTPILQIIWKPEFSSFSVGRNDVLKDYIDRFAASCSNLFTSVNVSRLSGALDLLAHSNPNMKILEIGDDSIASEGFLHTLDADTKFKRFRSYTEALINAEGHLEFLETQSSTYHEALNPEKTKFDLVILVADASHQIEKHFEDIKPSLEPASMLLLIADDSLTTKLELSGFKIISAQTTIVAQLPQALRGKNGTNGRDRKSNEGSKGTSAISFVLVEREGEEAFGDILENTLLKNYGILPSRIYLHNASVTTIPSGSTVFSTAELSKPLLQNITSTELESVKAITDNAATIIWLTGGGLFKSERPEFTIVNGVSRTVMLEQPTTKFFVIDFDDFSGLQDTTMKHILWVAEETRHNPKPQFEYLSYKGVLYTSRFQGEKSLNRTFQSRQNAESVRMSLREAGHCNLSIKTPGLTDTLYFSQHDIKEELEANCVEVDKRCVGLNAKDILILGGKVDAKDGSCALEFTGIITRIGPGVTNLLPGDRVVVMAPNGFETFGVVPEWACCRLADDESFEIMCSVPLVFSTAIHGLQNLARLQKGESILIHSAAGGVGIAAIQIAKNIGAKIFVTVGTEAKKQFLVDEFRLDPDHIFDSRGTTFLPAVLAATSGRGVDVILNSLVRDQLHDSLTAVAEFGRFIEIGKKDIVDSGKLDMGLFIKNVTFSAFDISSFYHSEFEVHHRKWSQLLHQSIQMLREKKIKPIHPLKVFDVSNISQAYRHLSLRTRMGKIVVSLQNPNSIIQVTPQKYGSKFSPEKSYLLVGALGGIGRSLATWMFSRGARMFTFLNRSAADNPSGAQLVRDLQELGAEVNVVRGDVSCAEDVEKTIASLLHPLGGIMLAAMGLEEVLWTSMTHQAWHKSLSPKVKGVLNLHNSSQAQEHSHLEFFLLLSSMSGSLGTATEANYCAANSYLDAFARWRRSIGLRANAVGLGIISEVGYLHEHPEIEKLLMRKGIQPINEQELLQICDLAISSQQIVADFPGNEHFIEGHFLTGLESQGMVAIRKRGFEASSHVLDDPRADILANALFDEFDSAQSIEATEKDDRADNQLSSVISHLKPKGVRCASPTDPAFLTAVQSIIAEKICDLLLLSAEQLTIHTPLGTFGMDSMLAADSRHFIFHTFHVDIPFLMLLAPSTNVASLSGIVASQLWNEEVDN